MNNQELGLSYWLVSVQPHLKKVAVIILLVVDVVLLIFAVFSGVEYVSTGRRQGVMMSQMTQDIVSFSEAHNRQKPTEPAVAQTALLEERRGSYTLVAVIQNTTDRWALESVAYHFLIDGVEAVSGTTSLLAGEERYITEFNYESASIKPLAKIELTLTDKKWVNLAERVETLPFQLKIVNPKFDILSTAPTDQLSRATADIVNETVHDFSNIQFTALLLNNKQIVGAGSLLIDSLPSLSTRSVDVRFFNVLAVTNVVAHATVDVSQIIVAR